MPSPIRDHQSSSSQPTPSQPTVNHLNDLGERISGLSQQLDSMRLSNERERFGQLDGTGRSEYLKDRTQSMLNDLNDLSDEGLDEKKTQQLKALQSGLKQVRDAFAEQQKKRQEEEDRDWCCIL